MLAVNFLRFLGEVWDSFGGSWVVAGAAKSERVKGGAAVVATVTGALEGMVSGHHFYGHHTRLVVFINNFKLQIVTK